MAAEPLRHTSYVRDAVAPSYSRMRIMKPALPTERFPVYEPKVLIDRLLRPSETPDATVAHTLAVCSAYAYSDAPTLSMMMARMGMEDNRCREISRSVDAMFIRSTSFLVQSADGRVLILCYRGTPPLDLISWLLDADADPERVVVPGGEDLQVHGGFYRNTRITRPDIVAGIQSAMAGESVLESPVMQSTVEQWTVAASPDRTEPSNGIQPVEAIYLTGHSLGGALAGLMAIMLAMTESDVYYKIAAKIKGVYTFGQPMIGNQAFATAAQDALAPMVGPRPRAEIPYVRYVYEEDFAPHLPPTDSGSFAHFGRQFNLSVGQEAQPAPRPAGQMRNILGLPGAFIAFGAHKIRWLREIPFSYSLEDHLPRHYVTSLTPPGVRNEFGDDYYLRSEDWSGYW